MRKEKKESSVFNYNRYKKRKEKKRKKRKLRIYCQRYQTWRQTLKCENISFEDEFILNSADLS